MTSSAKENLYLRPGSRSGQLYGRAVGVLPGGNTRSTVFNAPYPMYARRGYGRIVVDEEGRSGSTSPTISHPWPWGTPIPGWWRR